MDPQVVMPKVNFHAIMLRILGSVSGQRISLPVLLSFCVMSVTPRISGDVALLYADGREHSVDSSSLLAQGRRTGRTYYIAPGGSDTSPGASPTSPWKTFTYAIPQLHAGDTLILLDGTYVTAASGNLSMTCTADGNARNGSSEAPITIKAQHQRKALLHNDGASRPILLSGCSWWIIDGLAVRGSDNPNSSLDSTLVSVTKNSSNNIIRNNLLFNTNRYQGGGGIVVYDNSTRNAVESNELYNFSRNGLYALSADGNIFRRNYCNARNYAKSPKGGPRACFDAYYAKRTIFENNIAEDTEESFNSKGSNNMFFGNISINAINQYHAAKHPQERRPCEGNYIENYLGIAGPRTVNGVFSRSCVNLTVKNSSFFGGTGNGVIADNIYDPRQGFGRCRPYSIGLCKYQQDSSILVQNVLIKDTKGGYLVEHAEQFSKRVFEYSLGWNNPKGTWRNGTETRDKATTPPSGVSLTPDIGSCRVFIPASSSLKGKGKDGQDIGANILYAYEQGALTQHPLWNPTTGRFPCGAVVPGVNDVPGQSCGNVHERLNVHTNGCSLPRDYAGPWPPPPGLGYLRGTWGGG
jgi:hypothetical protein